MKDLDNTETNLILKKLKNIATENENKEFYEWLKASPDNQYAFDEISKLWKIAKDPAENFEPDSNKSWEIINAKINLNDKNDNVRILSFSFIAKIAAIFIVILGIGWIFKNQFFKQPELITIKTANQKRTYFLPDSSKVVLNPNSSISFTPQFENSKREINLNGEAYFEITKDSLKPFSIFGPNAKIIVLGTSFNTRMTKYLNETEVEVFTGKVLFQNRKDPDQKTILFPGHKATLSLSGKIITDRIAGLNNNATKNNQLKFKNTNLIDVIDKVQKYFEVSIEIQNQEMKNCKFTGTFDNPSINEVIATISASLNFTFEERNGKYILKGGICP